MSPARPRSRSGRSAGPSEEAYRVLRSNLLVSIEALERPTVIVTSAVAGEGKTSTCAGLARSLAAAGLNVVVVDLDLRHPDVHRHLGGHNEVGVTDVLLEHRRLEQCLQRVELGSGASGRFLYLLATGSAVANPTELLGSRRTARLLENLSQQADIVLIDTPPVVPVADTLVIGRMVAGALLVAEARRTPVPVVNRAKDALTRNQTRLLGVVLNKVDHRDVGYGYGYGYGAPGPVELNS